MRYRTILSSEPLVSASTLVAIFVGFLAISSDAAGADCVLSEKNVALARVVAKEARVYFVSGPRKGAPQCPSPANACKLRSYLVSGDEVLTNATDDSYVCARFKSKSLIERVAYLPHRALEIVPSQEPSIAMWDGTWRRDSEAEIVIKSHDNEIEVSGNATWGGNDPERVKRGGVNTGELEGTGKPRGQVLAIGYDPDQSDFPPAENAAPDVCAAKLELFGRYLIVDDNGRCGGVNVSFKGLYVRSPPAHPSRR
jgi:hypothetical protein